MQFIVNDNNVVYKNFIIRNMRDRFHIVSYQNFNNVQNVKDHIEQDIITFNYLICAGWDNRTYYVDALQPHPFYIYYTDKAQGLKETTSLIDKIAAYDKSEFSNLNYYWFFIALAHMTDITSFGYQDDSLKHSINYLYLHKIKTILEINNLSLDQCIELGISLGYFRKNNRFEKGFLKVDKKLLISKFYNKAHDTEQAILAYNKVHNLFKEQE